MTVNGYASRSSDLAGKLKAPVNTLRIIVLALGSSVLVFTCVAVAVRASQPPQPADGASQVLTTLAIVLSPLALLFKEILAGTIIKNARARIAAGKFEIDASRAPGAAPSVLSEMGDAGKLFVTYQLQAIVGAALLEGVAFLCIAAFMLEGSQVALVLGFLLAAAIVAMVPRTPRVVEWINEQLRLLNDEKMLIR